MTNTPTNSCPVCENQHGNTIPQFCEHCGWEYFGLAIPDNPSLQEYYQLRLTHHQRQYELFKQKLEEQEQLQLKYTNLKSELAALEEEAGYVWAGVSVPQLPTKVINWEQVAPFKLRLSGMDVRKILSDRVILLLKKETRPLGNADFDHALTIRTDGMRSINAHTEELSIPTGSLPTGNYFLRIISMPCKSHLPIFFHKEQAQQPSFDWRKTIIAL